jgi:hypothetical protein
MAKLNRESLEFAKAHISKFYDSDFFPKPFEFEALWANWDEVITHLTCNDVTGYTIDQPRTFTSIKPNGTFRIVHQLDPINTLIYTALAYLVSVGIEKARVPFKDHVACSYRFDVDIKKGTFFANGSGYDGFIDKCQELSAALPYVLVSDITDFYNQIYLHRLQNAIELSELNLLDFSKDIERFLLDLNGNVSQGVPVGPAASIIMAEAVLIDVDNFIKESGFKHTRYVDDFRIFGDSKQDLRRFLARFTEYLYHNHRLTLAGDKTEIIRAKTFVYKYLESPENLEKKNIHDALAAIKSFKDAYATLEIDVDEKKIRPYILSKLFDEIIAVGKLDLGLARHILRRCRRYRIRSIAPALLNNFYYFLPVISDVVLYLANVTNETFVKKNLPLLVGLLGKSYITKFPFVKEWVGHYLANNNHLLSQDEIQEFLRKNGSVRNKAIAAYNLKSTHWIRSQKGALYDLPVWDRRAVIRSSSVLSKKEMDSWLNSVEKSSTNFTEIMTIKWLRSLK